jgi:hypothetical protein
VTCTYIQVTAGDHTSYDPVTGTMASTEQTASIRATLVSITQEEQDASGLKVAEKKAIWDRKGFPFDVSVEDILDIAEGPFSGRWEIVTTLAEPSESIYICGIRRT